MAVDRRERYLNRTDDPAKLGVSQHVIDACKRGDREAQRTVYCAYQRRVFSTALHFLNGNRTAAEDVIQDVFVRVFTQIGRFRNEAG